jgi:hypothetical protein
MAILVGIFVVVVLLGVSALAALFAIASEAEVLPARGEVRRGARRLVREDGARALRLMHRAR